MSYQIKYSYGKHRSIFNLLHVTTTLISIYGNYVCILRFIFESLDVCGCHWCMHSWNMDHTEL